MPQTLSFPPALPDPATIPVLAPRERFCVDADAIPRLTVALGAPAASELVIRLRDDLAHRLPMIVRLWADGALPMMSDVARGLPGPARALGLGDLARTAADLVGCAARPDPVAQAAVAARLARQARIAIAHLDAARLGGLPV